MKIRRLEIQDIPFLLEVRNADSTRINLENDTVFSLAQCEAWFNEEQPVWYIIEVLGEKVGYIRTKGEEVGCDIHPNFRRKGYARKAYEELLRHRSYASLWVFEDNFAKNLYMELGFVETGHTKLVRDRKYIQMEYNKAKKKSAIFTIVKDENYFIKVWLKYYRQFFSNEDIYILDHETCDGSTDNLDVNVVKIHNEVSFDHEWLVSKVQDFQKKLLEDYEVVVFTESDEILYGLSEPFDELVERFRKDSSLSYLTSIGYEIYHDIENEKPLIESEKILPIRNKWFRYTQYDKTLLTKIPLNYAVGFHTCNYPKVFSNLYMMHLHRVDFELMLQRHATRAKKWKLKQEDIQKGWGTYHAVGDREGVLEYFKTIPSQIEEIPLNHKKSLYEL